MVLGVVGHGYEILQNDKAFDFFEPFIASRAARFETAGALRDGERVWVLAKLADPIRVIGDDVVDRYLLLLEFTRRSRCRLHSVHAGPCCLSEHPQPCNKGGSAAIHVRHTRRMYQRLDEAQQEKLGEVIEATFQAATALFRHMAEIRLTSELRTAYLEHVFPRTAKQRAEDVKPERWERIMTILGDERWTPRQTWETLWALYNAVVRDEDYRETRDESLNGGLSECGLVAEAKSS